ncbi:MAG: hypothetical protein ITF98_00600 [Fermentimonas sp.]|nr:hypothetical protein [Fermentimonas sp.]
MNTDIRKLIDRYFEGETTSLDEQMLRDYFANENVPQDLMMLAPLFEFISNQTLALTVLNEIKKEEKSKVIRVTPILKNYRIIASIAVVLIVAIVLVTETRKEQIINTGSYVWVDGKQFKDPETVMKYAETSFGNIKTDRDIIDEQLNFIFE